MPIVSALRLGRGDMNPAAQTEGISRRRMLKRIGAGAAVAWVAPVVTSIYTPAFAISGSCDPQRCETCPALGCPGSDFQPCDGPGCSTGVCYGGLGCFIHEDSERVCPCCWCLQNAYCGCLSPCNSNS